MQKTTTITSEKEDHIESKKDHSHRICKGRDIESEKTTAIIEKNTTTVAIRKDQCHHSEKRPPHSESKKTTPIGFTKDTTLR